MTLEKLDIILAVKLVTRNNKASTLSPLNLSFIPRQQNSNVD